MLDLLADELLLKITNYLPLHARLQFAATAHRNYRMCDDSLSLKKKLLKISAPLTVEPSLRSYLNYCKSRVARFKQEIAFFQLRQNDVLAILGNTPAETLFLLKLLKRVADLNGHLEKSGDETYIVQIDNLLNSLNARIINRQLRKGPSTANLSLSSLSRLPSHTLTQHKEYFQAVRRIDLHGNSLETLPETIAYCEALKSLNLYDNPISFLPRNIAKLVSLEYFYMSDGNLKKLPAEFFELTTLKWLALSNMQLESLPKEVEKLQALSWLYLANNRIEVLPREIVRLPKLREIFLEHNALRISQLLRFKNYFRSRGVDWKNLLETQTLSQDMISQNRHLTLNEERLIGLNLEGSSEYSPMQEISQNVEGLEPLDLDIASLSRRLQRLDFKN